MNIYFAGPDVFRPDYSEFMMDIKHLCQSVGIVPLLPGDTILSGALTIFNYNIELIKKSDGVIANLNPYRGLEPDSGTVFECGFAYGLGKQVVAYMEDHRNLSVKSSQTKDNFVTEEFNLPLNLMLGVSINGLYRDYQEAIRMADNHFKA